VESLLEDVKVMEASALIALSASKHRDLDTVLLADPAFA
jgi:hypothetical protein